MDETPLYDHSNESYCMSSTFMWHCLLCCTMLVLTVKFVDETLVCDHSLKAIEQYVHVVLIYVVQGGSNF